MAHPAFGAQPRFADDGGGQQFVGVKAALHQRRGAALANEGHRLLGAGVAVRGRDDLHPGEVEVRGLRRSPDAGLGADQHRADQPVPGGQESALQAGRVARMDDGGGQRWQRPAAAEQDLQHPPRLNIEGQVGAGGHHGRGDDLGHALQHQRPVRLADMAGDRERAGPGGADHLGGQFHLLIRQQLAGESEILPQQARAGTGKAGDQQAGHQGGGGAAGQGRIAGAEQRGDRGEFGRRHPMGQGMARAFGEGGGRRG